MFIINGNTIEITRGDTGEFDIALNNIDGTPYEPQEGDVITFTVKKGTQEKEILIQKTGQHIEIKPDDTKDLLYGTYKYDIQVTFANGKVCTVVTPSDFKIKDEVTF